MTLSKAAKHGTRSIWRTPIQVSEADENLVLPPSLDQEIVPGVPPDDKAQTAKESRAALVARQIGGLYPAETQFFERVFDFVPE